MTEITLKINAKFLSKIVKIISNKTENYWKLFNRPNFDFIFFLNY